MKKYRLKINYSEITEGNFNFVQKLREFDGDILQEGEYLRPTGTMIVYKVNEDIPKSWLTEIKEGLSFEEYWNEFKNTPGTAEIEESRLIWNAAIENYKLSQEPSEEKDEKAYQKFICGLTNDNFSYSVIWAAALKHARGQE